MNHTSKTIRIAGSWLAIASLLMVVTFIFHGPIAHEHSDQMNSIATGVIRWTAVHWVAAVALSLFAVSGLLVLSAGSRLTKGWWTTTAWAVLPVGALWTMITAVTEATVIANAAISGNIETFDAWSAFSEGMATGFTFVALAVAVIAANEVQSFERVVPVWSAWIGMLAGIASFGGWALGMWIGIDLGNLVWVVSSLLMSLWTFWFGAALMRSEPVLSRAGSPPDKAEERRTVVPAGAKR
jgi:hypothetical protein